MLVIQTSGGSYELFFEGVGKPVDVDSGPLTLEDQLDVERIVKFAAQHGIEIPPVNSKRR